MLQEKVDQWASGLKEERAKHYKLQRDYEAALSQQQRDKEELIHLTCKNQQLTLEQKRPQGDPKDDHKRQRAQDNLLTAKFKQEQGKNNKLQKDLEVALSKQHNDKDELMLLTSKNQKLALELKRLRAELKDDHKRQRAQDIQRTLKFKQEQGKYNKLKNDLEVSLSQQQKDREKLMLMPYKNRNLQKLEQNRLRGELKDDPKRELAQDNQWALKLTQEQGKYNKLQKDYEAALSQQQKDKEELMLLTCKNHQLALDKNRLQGELEDVQLKRELSLIQLKKDRDTCTMLEEKLQKYKTRLLREIKQNEQQKKASTATESKMNDMHTPRMENENIMAKFEAKDRSESTTTLAQLEDALHKETAQRSILEERTIHIASALERERERANQSSSAPEKEQEKACQSSSALEKEREKDYHSSSAPEKERATRDKYCVELKEGLTKQKKEQTKVQLRQPDELRLNEQQRAQHNPQRQHTDLGRKHKQIHSNFHEPRIPPPTSRTTKSCSALQKGSPAHLSVGLSRTQKGQHSF
ncbi:unnamed protein product [Pleuronectes platessa]|uniref:Uncharacterized protein n=1 Tax=Pleuronectes platessa TaxID=8262 RepID=A0A9N7U8F8_PLEPL|nr:unnamed protein product [Pleuronectes platessa]